MNIAMLISGGVDSSVALHRLVQQGHKVTAFYLKIWLEDALAFLGICPWDEDLLYVRSVCDKLNVDLEVVSFQQEYWKRVVSYTISEIRKGRTPNPDMLCNQQVKFGAFYERFGDQFDAFATGHYAQVRTVDKGGGDKSAQLYRSPDPIKDQTYFLARLSQRQLQKALFPIGHMTKAELRTYAHEIDLPTKARKDSQGICFLGALKFSEFVQFHLGERDGALIEYETGTVVGHHKGAWFYTIGQRQGIGLSGGPWYVVSKDMPENRVYISKTYHQADKKRDTLAIEELVWLSEEDPREHFLVKLRHGPQLVPATITYLPEQRAKLVLNQQDQGIASGQFAVLYDGDRCVASGVIV